MPKYIALMSVDGYIEVEVKAQNPQEAKQKAYDEFCKKDFGALCGAEASLTQISNGRGKIVYEDDNVYTAF